MNVETVGIRFKEDGNPRYLINLEIELSLGDINYYLTEPDKEDRTFLFGKKVFDECYRAWEEFNYIQNLLDMKEDSKPDKEDQ